MRKFSTYSRVILSDHKVLVELVQKYSDPKAAIVRELEKDITTLDVITETALADSIKHPHAQFLMHAIKTLGERLTVVKQIQENKDSIRSKQIHLSGAAKASAGDLDAFTDEELRTRYSAIEDIERAYLELERLNGTLDGSLNELAQATRLLGETLQEQDKEWDDYRLDHNEQLVKMFEANEFPISDMERNELLCQDSWVSMLNTVRDLKIQIPNNMDIENPTAGTYFKLKAYLAMYASLSRRMLPNSPEDIENL